MDRRRARIKEIAARLFAQQVPRRFDVAGQHDANLLTRTSRIHGCVPRTFELLDRPLANQAFFVYALVYKDLNGLAAFVEIVCKLYTIFFGVPCDANPAISMHSLANIIDLVATTESRQDYVETCYAHLYATMPSHAAMEFLSLVFYAVPLLAQAQSETTSPLWRACGVPHDAPLSRRLTLALTPAVACAIGGPHALFKMRGRAGVVAQFFGRFASGLPNVFRGCVPADIDLAQLRCIRDALVQYYTSVDLPLSPPNVAPSQRVDPTNDHTVQPANTEASE